MSPRSRDLRIADILNAIEQVESTLAGLSLDQFLERKAAQGAVCWYVFVAAEAAVHLDDQLTDALPEIPWREVRGMRNFLAHGYFRLDMRIVWHVATHHLPVMKEALQRWRA